MGAGRSGGLVVRVAFECVELDAVQLLEALAAALTREVVLHLCCVLLHVPVERCPLPTLVPANFAPVWREEGPGAGHHRLRLPCKPLRSPPSRAPPHSLQGRLSSVGAPVYLQMVLPLERLAAGLTSELSDAWGWQQPQDTAQ